MKKFIQFSAIASILALTSMSTLAQTNSETYELLVCGNRGSLLFMEQNTTYYCGPHKKKYTVDELYSLGYRLISSSSITQTYTTDHSAGMTLFFEKKVR